MSFSALFNLPQSSPGWDLIKSLSNYYGLKDYLSRWYIDRFEPERVKKYQLTGWIPGKTEMNIFGVKLYQVAYCPVIKLN